MAEHLLLKFGTLKGWEVESDASLAAIRRYHEEPVAFGLMEQRDSATQKQALCDLIDAIDGPIQNDWTGEMMTKDEAKKYVRDYRL
ncbi:MAG: hypothetical protein DI629_12315 [Mesorhizobium amorphae]|nr:MAG: hypothetical protein DI629_12315 [Mesorhizobium amorphae]